MQNSLLKIIKDPLWHFLLAGAAVFLIFKVVNPEDTVYESPKTIVIDRDILLTELQFRTKTFQPELASRQLNALSPKALDKLINDYVRSEVLYREANGLGFGENDYIIKKRMIQKMDFIIQDVSEAATQATDEEVEKYYAENTKDYVEPAHVTFTHVFFDREARGMQQALTEANAMLVALNAEGASFTDAPKYGDRFPFGLNYVEKPQDLVASHFGPGTANTLFELTPQDNVWQGPIVSEHGAHLVMLISHQAEQIPLLADVRDEVLADVERKLIETQRLKAIDKLVEAYTVKNNYQPASNQTVSSAKKAMKAASSENAGAQRNPSLDASKG